MRKNSGFTFYLTLVFIACLFGCQRENISVPEESAQVQSNTVIPTPCSTCTDFDLAKTAGNPNVADEVAGVLQVCQPSATEITFTFTVSEDREDAWINQYGITIDPTGENFTKLSPGFIDRTKPDDDKARQATITIDYTDYTKPDGLGGVRPLMPGDIICVAAYANIPGKDGVGGQVWAGSVPPNLSGNPHPRSFCYVIKDCVTPPNPDPNCTFTQGYWFAKPGGWLSGKGRNKIPSGSHWPDNTENEGFEFGGYKYTYLQARDIFFGSNKRTGKTDAKQAFLQGFALKLSMYGNSQTEPCPGTLDALNAIEAYFAAKGLKQTASTINTYAPNASLRTAAGLISDCLNANHCDNTPIPTGQ